MWSFGLILLWLGFVWVSYEFHADGLRVPSWAGWLGPAGRWCLLPDRRALTFRHYMTIAAPEVGWSYSVGDVHVTVTQCAPAFGLGFPGWQAASEEFRRPLVF